ncbi:hypothetical protein [Sedimentimonas flavescens]|uniref:hypothetical protein n=1 Tax=Sedimentimonas flavescens TaxID=2851012 RepID=UPI001C49F3C3|nr:hypothetical protein [Sedimentimonas flavescens]MBW0159226.1 hypothetical protein [Sedimentimonas flavescens]
MSDVTGHAANVTAWLDWLKFGVTVISPFVAVLGGYYVFLAQRSHERQEALRRKRQELYVACLAADRNVKPGATALDTVTALGPFLDDLRIVAPTEVVEAMLRYFEAKFKVEQSKVKKPAVGVKLTQKEFDEFMKVQDLVRNARHILVTEMRRDVLKGADISEQLADVEDLAK